MVIVILVRKGFWMVNTWQVPIWKQLKWSTFKLCTHISNRLLHKIVPAFFLTMTNSFFIKINQTSFESVFCMKTGKTGLIKKHLKRRKSHARSCLSLGWLYNREKIIENCKSAFFFFNWDSLHARLNSHYEAWSYKKKSIKKITGYRKSF